MDFYLSDNNVVERLVREWKQYKNIVIAYDFDNTVYDYHGEGHTYEDVIELLRNCKTYGATLVVFTANDEDKHPFIEDYLKRNNIPYDYINETPKHIPVKTKKKIYYNILLDDRAGLKSAYKTLSLALYKMISEEIND